MTALVILKERGRAEAERMSVCGVPFFKVTLPRRGVWKTRHAWHTARMLKAGGIQTAVFVKDFPYTDIFEKCGIFPVDIRPLRLTAAAQIVCAALRETGTAPETAFVAVKAPRSGAAVEALVLALSRSVRYVSLDAPGKEALGERLRFCRGVALREDAANAAITLSLFEGERCAGKTLALFDEGLHISYAADAKIEGCGQEELLAALLLGGWQGGKTCSISLH